MGWKDKIAPVDEGYTEEAIATSKTGGGDIKWLGTPFDGYYVIRVLPAGLDGRWALKIGKHRSMPNPKGDERDEDGKEIKTDFLCLEYTFPEKKKPCPICEVIREFAKLGVNTTPWDPRVSTYYNTLIRLAPPGDWGCNCPSKNAIDTTTQQPVKVTTHEGVHVFSHTEYTMEWLNGKRHDEAFGNFLDPIEGRDFRIIKKRKNGRVSYDRELLPTISRIAGTDEEIEKILDQRVEFTQGWKFPDDDLLQRMMTSTRMLRTMLSNKLPGSTPAHVITTQAPPQAAPPASAPSSGTPPPAPAPQSTGTPAATPAPAGTASTETYTPPSEASLAQPVVEATPVVAPPQAVAPSQAPPAQAPVPMVPTQTDEGKTIIWTKQGHPECYADKDVYKKDANQTALCDACPFEFECIEDCAKVATGNFVIKRRA